MKLFVYDQGWYGAAVRAESLEEARRLYKARCGNVTPTGSKDQGIDADHLWEEFPLEGPAAVVFSWQE